MTREDHKIPLSDNADNRVNEEVPVTLTRAQWHDLHQALVNYESFVGLLSPRDDYYHLVMLRLKVTEQLRGEEEECGSR